MNYLFVFALQFLKWLSSGGVRLSCCRQESGSVGGDRTEDGRISRCWFISTLVRVDV
jgi:hypothetical protein